jgi:hypothetical protein
MSISSAFRELTGKDWIEGIGIAASVAGVLLTIGYQGGQIREELSLAKTELVGVKQELAALKGTAPDVAFLKIRVDACCPYYKPGKATGALVRAVAVMP